MKANKIIREVMKSQNEKVASLADKLGLVPSRRFATPCTGVVLL